MIRLLTWHIGQRVTTELEPELGLGIITETSQRIVEVSFPKAQIYRQYTVQSAPLHRLVLGVGQKIKIQNGKVLTIQHVEEKNSLLLYHCGDELISESLIHELVEDETPLNKFLIGRWAPPQSFDLRREAWEIRGRSLDPDIRGLVGNRVSLLPHQLFIASEVSKRELPRVLLADEVGLGKTIESGLIFSSLKALERAERVLIVVPEALEHQWLFEMYRRFQVMFSVIDEERCEQETSSQELSAFEMNQRIICSLPFLGQNAERLQEAMEIDWDLLIVDEAHRLQWSQKEPSISWEIIRLLSSQARGLLLLTATPERKGPETEFGLLHLVDPLRFPDYPSFLEEHKKMREVAQLASRLHKKENTAKLHAEIKRNIPLDADLKNALTQYKKDNNPEPVLTRLIDRHGTGRVLIRNRRNRIKGFSERLFSPIPLKPPKEWLKWLETLKPSSMENGEAMALSAGITAPPKDVASVWLHERATALVDLLKKSKTDKVLLICSNARRVELLQNWLRKMSPIKTAIFHEGLEIVERDRQAAWFADPSGARVLLCSEIGGEGRNFQFCHHLFLFDLPLHPDAVEQRIGRLDRIGQLHPIQSHLPFFEDSPEEVLAKWYSQSLQIFTKPWNGGAIDLSVLLANAVKAYLPKSKYYANRSEKLEKLIESGKANAERVRKEQRESVDILIDLNSFNENRGQYLSKKIKKIDEDSSLRVFLEKTFDHFGIETEKLDNADNWKITAHSLTFIENFPGLNAQQELLSTFNRDTALTREELELMTWEHPVFNGALSLILEGGTGRMAAGVVQRARANALFDLLYVLQASSPAYLEVERDLPLKVFQIQIALGGEILPTQVWANHEIKPLPEQHRDLILPVIRDELPNAIKKASSHVKSLVMPIIKKSVQSRVDRLKSEQSRLKELCRLNPIISKKEIKMHETNGLLAIKTIESTEPRLDAIRLILKGN